MTHLRILRILNICLMLCAAGFLWGLYERAPWWFILPACLSLGAAAIGLIPFRFAMIVEFFVAGISALAFLLLGLFLLVSVFFAFLLILVEGSPNAVRDILTLAATLLGMGGLATLCAALSAKAISAFPETPHVSGPRA